MSKIHDLIMDFSFHKSIGEEIAMTVLNERIIQLSQMDENTNTKALTVDLELL